MGEAHVFVTKALRDYWESQGNKTSSLRNAFAKWKNERRAGKGKNILFGQDGACDAPLIDGSVYSGIFTWLRWYPRP